MIIVKTAFTIFLFFFRFIWRMCVETRLHIGDVSSIRDWFVNRGRLLVTLCDVMRMVLVGGMP